MGSPGVASFDDAISPLRQAPPDPTPFTYNLWGLPTRLTVFLLALHLFASVKIILRIDRIPGTTFFSLDQHPDEPHDKQAWVTAGTQPFADARQVSTRSIKSPIATRHTAYEQTRTIHKRAAYERSALIRTVYEPMAGACMTFLCLYTQEHARPIYHCDERFPSNVRMDTTRCHEGAKGVTTDTGNREIEHYQSVTRKNKRRARHRSAEHGKVLIQTQAHTSPRPTPCADEYLCCGFTVNVSTLPRRAPHRGRTLPGFAAVAPVEPREGHAKGSTAYYPVFERPRMNNKEDKTQTSEARMGPKAKGSYYSPDALATMVAMLSSTYTDIVTVTIIPATDLITFTATATLTVSAIKTAQAASSPVSIVPLICKPRNNVIAWQTFTSIPSGTSGALTPTWTLDCNEYLELTELESSTKSHLDAQSTECQDSPAVPVDKRTDAITTLEARKISTSAPQPGRCQEEAQGGGSGWPGDKRVYLGRGSQLYQWRMMSLAGDERICSEREVEKSTIKLPPASQHLNPSTRLPPRYNPYLTRMKLTTHHLLSLFIAIAAAAPIDKRGDDKNVVQGMYLAREKTWVVKVEDEVLFDFSP
ncbi:hypothetical protein B0H65DRAFT_553577 [Neurospora tetraspora]|uniref:Uncharacterized protein n=1 Tax=Neurospora tetraspora TaxID=94610 RepID=A0AAE0MJD2_9PEZI|nr:hypothetical protein B0H65DRAFT_553577 [Neurospora tetraspora]